MDFYQRKRFEVSEPKTFEANQGGASNVEYSLPFPAGGRTGATEVRQVVHAHSLSQPGPF